MGNTIAMNRENKELDRLSNLGTSKVYKQSGLKEAIKNKMAEEDIKDSVMAFIFDRNPDSVSPLQDIRDCYK